MKQFNKTDAKFIRFFLIIIWILLIGFGFISITKPIWLLDLSEAGKSMEAQQNINKGYEALKNKNYKVALNSYNEALERQPENEGAYYGIGVAYSELKQYEKSIENYQMRRRKSYP